MSINPSIYLNKQPYLHLIILNINWIIPLIHHNNNNNNKLGFLLFNQQFHHVYQIHRQQWLITNQLFSINQYDYLIHKNSINVLFDLFGFFRLNICICLASLNPISYSSAPPTIQTIDLSQTYRSQPVTQPPPQPVQPQQSMTNATLNDYLSQPLPMVNRFPNQSPFANQRVRPPTNLPGTKILSRILLCLSFIFQIISVNNLHRLIQIIFFNNMSLANDQRIRTQQQWPIHLQQAIDVRLSLNRISFFLQTNLSVLQQILLSNNNNNNPAVAAAVVSGATLNKMPIQNRQPSLPINSTPMVNREEYFDGKSSIENLFSIYLFLASTNSLS